MLLRESGKTILTVELSVRFGMKTLTDGIGLDSGMFVSQRDAASTISDRRRTGER